MPKRIAEAASRPSMRFVALKSEDPQAQAMLFRTRDLLVRQRTQLVNALRGHLAEHGIVAAYGLANVKVLAAALGEGSVHPLVRELGQRYLDHIARLDVEIGELEKRLRQLCRNDETSVRLQTMPGIGPVTAAAIEAFAPPMATFKRGRDFAAWLGLVPRQHATGPDVEDGTARHSSPADHWCHGGCAMGSAQGSCRGVVAWPDDGKEATAAGGHCSGKQDGPISLGDAQQGPRVSRISAGAGLTASALMRRR
jgi:hypothetical protein